MIDTKSARAEIMGRVRATLEATAGPGRQEPSQLQSALESRHATVRPQINPDRY